LQHFETFEKNIRDIELPTATRNAQLITRNAQPETRNP